MRYAVIGTGEELARFVARALSTEGGYVASVSVQKLDEKRIPAVRIEAFDGPTDDAPSAVVTFTMRSRLGIELRDFDGLEAVARAFVRRVVTTELIRVGAHIRINLRDGVLARVGSRPFALGARELALVQKLVAASGQIVDRESLFRAAWPGESFAQNRLHHYMMKLRRRLGSDAEALRTVHGVGYRLVSTTETDSQERRVGARVA